jgi:acetyltransferase
MSPAPPAEIRRVSAEQARPLVAPLIALLQDAVHDGASIGFLRPLSDDAARRYWDEVIADVAANSRVLLVASRDGAVVGTAQLGLCTKPNGVHRAEVQKVLVHTGARRLGLGRALMARLEVEAVAERRTLLYLDTQPEQAAERMYVALGWSRAGEIPGYARTPEGGLHGTVLYYKRLGGP